MPRTMTMNGHHRSVTTTTTTTTAPLDLRTNHRERSSGGAGCCSVSPGRSPPPPAAARTGTSGSDATCPTDNSSGVRCAESGAARKRSADSSSLPFRKRTFPVEPEPQPGPELAGGGERVCPREDLVCRGRVGESRVDAAAAATALVPRGSEGAGHAENRPVRVLHHCSYSHYPVYYWPSVPEPNRIALATHQDEDGDTALHIAVVQGELNMVLTLIQLLWRACRSLDIYNNLRQTPLHLAVITKQVKMVTALLREGAEPAALDRNGQTAVHLCCEYNQHECLAVLLFHPTAHECLEIRNFEGLSPLHLAVRQGHKAIARMLLDAGGDINAMDIKSGQSPLMLAVESNNADMVHFLIENGCDVNSQAYSGNTALHGACGRGQVDTVRLLLKSGADSSLKNYHNDTPVMVANNKKISDVLRGRGSKPMRDQHCASVSPHGSNLSESGSQSPCQSRGCSPSTTPHTPHRSSSRSPKTPSTYFHFTS